ncbi:ComE operon protein 3 [Pontiella desulfatans]|uniref:ComE operon protein 3 n=2 Tax=Pontiella desulfatans TaxID=2750659 RepID=A0A6C2U2A5_PONDE|nr:ComE operon protein 3 [Pontiella desulfatans]
MVGGACAVAGGMLFASLGLVPIGLFFFGTLFLIGLAFLFRQNRFSSLLTFLVVAMVAASHFLVSGSRLEGGASVDRLRDRLPLGGVGVVGHVSGFPEYHPYRSGARGTWTFPLRLEGISISSGWVKSRGVIDVRITGARPESLVGHGQRVLLEGRLCRSLYPGGSTIQLELDHDGRQVVLSERNRFSPVVWGRAWRESAARRLEAGVGGYPLQQAVMKALVLGYRKEIPQETLSRFRRTGSVHVFAISGLHVCIVGLLLSIVLKSLGVPRDWIGVWLLPLLLFYVVSTGMKPSAMRALAMAGVFVLAPLFRRKPDVPSSVALAAVLLLIMRPAELLSAGFIFSFTVVVFIVMVFSKVPDRLLKGGWIKGYTGSLVVTSFAASLASIPLAALYFGMFSPIALVGNLIVVPLTFCIVLSGWLSILLPVASSVFNFSGMVFIDLLLGCVRWLDRLPGSSWQVSPPPLLAVLAWYGSLIYLFTHASSRRQCWFAAAGVCGAVVLTALS